MTTPNLATIVKAFGTPAALARHFGWPRSTVHAWMKNDRIPDWRMSAIRHARPDLFEAATTDADGQPLPGDGGDDHGRTIAAA